MKFIDIQSKIRLAKICKEHHFRKRGNAYFRTIGDGVLQIIKIEYERVFSHFSLKFGLHSMYGAYQKFHFTSFGCITGHYIKNIIGEKTAVSVNHSGQYVSFGIETLEKQLDYLEDTAMDWLDSITTQNALADALCFLDNQLDNSIIWNDSLKLVPYLQSRQYSNADKVINHILYQHTREELGTIPWSEEDYETYTLHFPGRDLDFLQLHKWIYDNDETAIKAWLQNNYIQNCANLHL